MSSSEKWEPGPEAIRSLVELLSQLDMTPATAWDGGEKEEGVFVMPSRPPDEVESKFMHRAYEHGWVYSFDWLKWQDEAERYCEDSGLLATADVETLRKLITTHLRKERFCEGHLRAVREDGHLSAIVRRLAQLAR